MATNWRVYGKDTVACKLTKADLPGFFRKTFIVGPTEAAVVIKNGKLQGTVTGTKESVSGLLDKMASLFRGGTDIDVIFIDTTPVDLFMYLGEATKESHQQATSARSGSGYTDEKLVEPATHGVTEAAYSDISLQSGRDISEITLMALSLDKEVISAECIIRVSVLLEDAESLSGLLKGRNALATWDLAAMIKSEILAKVLIPQIAAHRADELRGNRELLESFLQDVRKELQRTCNTWGLGVEDFIINWGLTDAEIAEVNEKRFTREEEARDFAHRRQLADMQRELDVDKTILVNLQQLKVAEASGDEELTSLYLAADLDREKMVDGQRLNTAQVDAQIELVQLDIKRQEGNLRLEIEQRERELDFDYERKRKELESELDGRELKEAMDAFQQVQQAKRERVKLQQDFMTDQMKMQTDSTEKLMSQAIDKGIADPETLREMMKQQTLQRALDRSDEKVDSMAQSEAAKANMDSFKDAEDRERKHQVDMTGQAADMMEASKQDVPHTLVQGGGVTPSVHMSIPTSSQSPDTTGKCSGCGFTVQPHWKVCPECGNALQKEGAKCPSCNAVLEQGWRACAFCGHDLEETAT